MRDEVERRRLAEKLSAHRLQMAASKRIAEAENLQRRRDERRHEPVALARLPETAERDESAVRLLFQGLTQHYMECLMAGRIDIWANAARQIVELLSSPMTKVHKRSDIADYCSDRVFDGTRPLSGERINALKRSYARS